MVEIMDIDPQIVIDNNNNSIGAQYILKGIDETFWEDVEKDSEKLFRDITELNKKKKQEDPSYHELQIWCADMWAVLWNGWKRGYQTKCNDDLSFSWGTSSEFDYHKHNIMHNAGVITNEDGLFYKSDYVNSLPYDLNLDIKEKSASKKYYEWVKSTERKTILK